MKQIFTMDVEKSIKNGVKFSKLLAKNNIRGEFYICGYLVEKHRKECKEIAKKHIIGGHGYHHEDFAKLSIKEQKDIIEKTKEIFERNGIKMVGWRFPGFNFRNDSLKIIYDLKLYDSSLRRTVVRNWGQFGFIRNWVRNLMLGNLFFPYTFPRNLDERPWDIIDLGSKEFWKTPGRIVIHCFNYTKFEKKIKEWIEKGE